MSHIKVFGHKSPDTDSTCAPLVWAWYLSEKKGVPAQAYLLGEPNTEALFVLDYWKVQKPELLGELTAEDKTYIVDTNNPQELPDNINETQITGIIDHHKLVGGLETSNPIHILMRPLACTTTLMHEIMDEDTKQNLPKEIAGLMLSAILSDTLEFRSPTTTDIDKKVAEKLAQDLGINISEYATQMFDAKSDISHFTDAELLRLDSKKYEVGGTNFRVSVLETTNPGLVLDRKDSLKKAMKTVAAEDGVDQVLLFIVDILKEESTLIIPNDFTASVAQKSFDASVNEDLTVLPGVVSRKKQIIPALKV